MDDLLCPYPQKVRARNGGYSHQRHVNLQPRSTKPHVPGKVAAFQRRGRYSSQRTTVARAKLQESFRALVDHRTRFRAAVRPRDEAPDALHWLLSSCRVTWSSAERARAPSAVSCFRRCAPRCFSEQVTRFSARGRKTSRNTAWRRCHTCGTRPKDEPCSNPTDTERKHFVDSSRPPRTVQLWSIRVSACPRTRRAVAFAPWGSGSRSRALSACAEASGASLARQQGA